MKQEPNKGIECKCEEDHNGNCYFCGRNMLSSPLTMEEETSEWRYFRTLNLPFDKAHAEKDGLRFDLEEVNMEETISSAVTQALKEEREEIIDKVNKKKLKLSQAKIETLEGELMREAVNVTLDEVISLLSNNK